MTDTMAGITAPTKSGNGMAVTALVLGIVGAVFGLVPLTGFIAFICGVLALIFGIVGRKRVTKGITADGKKMATWGAVLGFIAAGLGILGMTIVFGAVDQFESDMEQISEDLDRDMAEFEAEMDKIDAEFQQDMDELFDE